MEETTYLKQKIKDCRHKLNLAKILENCVYYISFGALAAVLVEGISLFVPFYYANYFAAGCIGIGCLVGIVRALMTWADEKAAARKLDSFGLQERTLTAYENLDKEDAFTKLQRNDAIQMLKENENNICIPIRPNTRHLLAFFFSLVCVCTLAMVPSVAKEQAKELHALKQEIKEKKKELSSVMDALEGIDTKSLSAEEKKKLQELMKSLEMSKKELDQVESAQELASANERLQFKYQETAQSLTGIDPSKIGVKEAQQIAQAASGQVVLRMEMILPVQMVSLQMAATIMEIPSHLPVTAIMEITLPGMETRRKMEMETATATATATAMAREMATVMEVAAEMAMARETGMAMETVTEAAAEREAEEEPVRALQRMIMLPFPIKSVMTAPCMETKPERTILITTGRRMVLPGKEIM